MGMRDINKLYREMGGSPYNEGITEQELVRAEVELALAYERRAELDSILKKEQKKQKNGNRRLDDFSEQQLNDGLH